jgi:two-component system, chemotaxis family, protein-glutamate methylesterase/glutaminase
MPALNKKVRVLIVEDSAFMRKVLHDIIVADPTMEVAGQARDGREGVSLAESLQPDVITMDVNMPRLDGLQATELIMTQNPRPIVIVSSESREGTASTLRALELGAVDFVPKPVNGIDLDMRTVGEELRRKLKMAAKVRVVRTATLSRLANVQARGPIPRVVPTNGGAPPAVGAGRFPVILIAASTGGPATVMDVVSRLPRDLHAAVVVVLHMPASFTHQYSVQLAEVSALRVKDAEHNEIVQPGTVYVCPGSHHLRFAGSGRIALDSSDRIGGYRPCADVALETAAQYLGPMLVSVILTGMGNDGAKGVKAVKEAGGYVIAQDEATSVIFGMPAEAIKTGAVDEVLALDHVPAAIERRALQIAKPISVMTR